MDTVRLSSGGMSENKFSSNGSAQVAKRMTAQQQPQARKATALIHKSAPDFGNGNGKLVNLYA
jgi:hypothetical protein